MQNIRFLIAFSLALIPLTLSSCTPISVAAGAGATLGIASAKEGGISGAANDLRIKTLISERWFNYKVDTFRKLNLTVDQGRVLITGIVQSPDDRVEAVRLAWQVSGVKQVINEIRVADGEGVSGFIKDTWITTRLRTVMTFDKGVQAINYSIDTVDGTVYLMGVATSQNDLDRAVALARTIPGVKQVVTYVKPIGQPVANDGGGTSPTLSAPGLSSRSSVSAADPYAPSSSPSSDPYAASPNNNTAAYGGSSPYDSSNGGGAGVAPVTSTPLSPSGGASHR